MTHATCSFGRGIIAPGEPMASLASSSGGIWPAYASQKRHVGSVVAGFVGFLGSENA